MISTLVKRTSIATCLIAASVIGTSATADTATKTIIASNNDAASPPVGFQGARWTAANGCAYTRAGRPGETVWYLIINTSAGKECRRVIPQATYADGAYAGIRS